VLDLLEEVGVEFECTGYAVEHGESYAVIGARPYLDFSSNARFPK
jgi:hypothetical protein